MELINGRLLNQWKIDKTLLFNQWKIDKNFAVKSMEDC